MGYEWGKWVGWSMDGVRGLIWVQVGKWVNWGMVGVRELDVYGWVRELIWVWVCKGVDLGMGGIMGWVGVWMG